MHPCVGAYFERVCAIIRKFGCMNRALKWPQASICDLSLPFRRGCGSGVSVSVEAEIICRWHRWGPPWGDAGWRGSELVVVAAPGPINPKRDSGALG